MYKSFGFFFFSERRNNNNNYVSKTDIPFGNSIKCCIRETSNSLPEELKETSKLIFSF